MPSSIKIVQSFYYTDHESERVVDHLPLMTYGLKLSLEAWILKFKKKSLI